MAPSVPKQKRLAEKAAKQAAKAGGSSTRTPLSGSTPGLQNGSTEDLAIKSMKKLNIATESGRSSCIDPKSRDIKIDQYTLSFQGRLLIEGAEIALNYGQRYGLLGENGLGRSTFLQSIAERDVKIPPYIDIYLAKFAKLEARIEELSLSEDPNDQLVLDAAYEELEELNPSAFEAKAGSVLHHLGFSQTRMKKPTKNMGGG
ncbi:ABC transporter ATP-binding protein arb1 [Marasmius crinis-equi]|uniref:ABC transporter ATP-binding protein arb1 n=1 Tax=Marasmius crinis-equi TaxID=585013 RepID=A0ABR3EKG0_9AGAR